MSSAEIYGPQHRALQEAFDTVRLADRVNETIVAAQMDAPQRGFIESRDFFFLSTIDHRGFPTCSHKGGGPGFVQVVDDATLAFPSYDGNGMYLSMGNIAANPKIGMLFIDFETPHRVRVHGTATLERGEAMLARFPGAELVVRVAIEEIFINCPRYIHRYRRVEASPYVPEPGRPVLAPQWKRIDTVQDVLPERDRQAAAARGGTITMDEYAELVLKGEG